MRYLTKTTLNAHLESSDNVVIYIPRGEVIETTPEQSGVAVRVTWRGQQLSTEQNQINSTAEPTK